MHKSYHYILDKRCIPCELKKPDEFTSTREYFHVWDDEAQQIIYIYSAYKWPLTEDNRMTWHYASECKRKGLIHLKHE